MSEDGPRRGPGISELVSMLQLDVLRHGHAWEGSNASDAMIELAVHAALAVVPPSSAAHYEITVVLTDDLEIKDLNKMWRGKDQPTNVLSFPAGDAPLDALQEGALNLHGEHIPLGDIVIAFETTKAEADEKGIPLADHLSHLVVHGTLHLLGLDHLDDDEAEHMEELERQALASLGIADPYGEDGNAGLENKPDQQAGLAEITE